MYDGLEKIPIRRTKLYSGNRKLYVPKKMHVKSSLDFVVEFVCVL